MKSIGFHKTERYGKVELFEKETAKGVRYYYYGKRAMRYLPISKAAVEAAA